MCERTDPLSIFFAQIQSYKLKIVTEREVSAKGAHSVPSAMQARAADDAVVDAHSVQ